jgi:hypothetical protein
MTCQPGLGMISTDIDAPVHFPSFYASLSPRKHVNAKYLGGAGSNLPRSMCKHVTTLIGSDTVLTKLGLKTLRSELQDPLVHATAGGRHT